MKCVDNIMLDNITAPLNIILTSSSSTVIQRNDNVSDSFVCSESDKSHKAKIEDYVSMKYDKVVLQHLKQ